MKSLARYKKDVKGQGLVEFALILPILLLVLMGLIQFGLILNGKIMVTSAAREGARLAAVGADYDTVDKKVKNVTGLNRNSILTSIEFEPQFEPQDVTVTVETPIEVIVPIISEIIGNPFILISSATMRLEVWNATPGTPDNPTPDDPLPDEPSPLISAGINTSKSGNHLTVKIIVDPKVNRANVSFIVQKEGDPDLCIEETFTTDKDGEANKKFNNFLKNNKSGKYTIKITGIAATGYEWDEDPINYEFNNP